VRAWVGSPVGLNGDAGDIYYNYTGVSQDDGYTAQWFGPFYAYAGYPGWWWHASTGWKTDAQYGGWATFSVPENNGLGVGLNYVGQLN
jgi:hypothetical protein